MGKFSFSELKIEKVKLFSQRLTKFYRFSDFNVGGSLAICLTFRPVLILDPQQFGCLQKEKHVTESPTIMGVLQVQQDF